MFFMVYFELLDIVFFENFRRDCDNNILVSFNFCLEYLIVIQGYIFFFCIFVI